MKKQILETKMNKKLKKAAFDGDLLEEKNHWGFQNFYHFWKDLIRFRNFWMFQLVISEPNQKRYT